MYICIYICIITYYNIVGRRQCKTASQNLILSTVHEVNRVLGISVFLYQLAYLSLFNNHAYEITVFPILVGSQLT